MTKTRKKNAMNTYHSNSHSCSNSNTLISIYIAMKKSNAKISHWIHVAKQSKKKEIDSSIAVFMKQLPIIVRNIRMKTNHFNWRYTLTFKSNHSHSFYWFCLFNQRKKYITKNSFNSFVFLFHCSGKQKLRVNATKEKIMKHHIDFWKNI